MHTRRQAIKSIAALATVQIVPSHVLGLSGQTPPSETLTKGIIGCGGISDAHLSMPGKLLALCDVDSKHLTQRMKKSGGEANGIKGYRDFRELLAQKDIDAVLIATGPNWHATASIYAAKAGKDIYLALDVAASEFFDKGKYQFEGRKVTYNEMIEYYEKIIARYPVLSIEDGLSENDWTGWKALTDALGKKVQLVGDDLFVTNTSILAKGIAKGISNSILIKLNQIGTVTETLDAIEMAKTANYTAVISHRSGETEDTTIADLAVACNTGFIKTGSLARSERVAKYNRLLQIEEELSESAQYKGRKGFYNLHS